ncbi:MAG: ribosome maturation factor RimM [Synechococcaceae cyanobacterium SM2_3_1]|nr:ribosome maturation factor RimM [Synechococcaceae cyanobacterium SM2_3_1]
MSVPRWQPVGQVVAAHGLKGWVRVHCLSDFPERLTEPGHRWLQRPGRDSHPVIMRLEQGQFFPNKRLYLVKFAELQDRNDAEAWIKAQILVSGQQRPRLQEDEFYLPDLIGMPVVHQPSGKSLGQVVGILPLGQDVLEVQTLQGGRLLIPFVKAIVPRVDLEAGYLEVIPPPGLLEGFLSESELLLLIKG